MVDKNSSVVLKCKRCGMAASAQEMRLDRNGKDMLCQKCNEQQQNRDKAMKNVKMY